MTKIPRLLEQLNEPWWDPTIGKFSSGKAERFLVYVEGGFDVQFFHRSVSRTIKERVEFRIAGGKDQVIALVKRDDKSFGVVDMDFDFKDHQIDQLPIIATNSDCCLFWKLVREIEGGDLQGLITKIVNRYATNGEAQQLHNRIHNDLSEIVSQMEKATIERLFRGHHREKGGEISHFEKHFSEQINKAGINDHDFEESIKNLFEEFGSNIEPYQIRSQIKEHLLSTEHALKSTKREKIANRFLKQL